MLGVESTAHTMPYTGPPQLAQSRPQPEQRVVEGSEQTTSSRTRTGSTGEWTQSTVARLVASARQFAAILDTTGDVRAASSVTGFPVRYVDLYA